ncbi:unnamed protein product [Rhodiola kirilowii]
MDKGRESLLKLSDHRRVEAPRVLRYRLLNAQRVQMIVHYGGPTEVQRFILELVVITAG